MTEKRIAVLGAGTMGAGIAQVAAQSGYDVLMYDIKDEFVERGLSHIRSSLQKRVDQEKMSSEEMAAVLERVSTTTTLEQAVSWPIIVEAAPEDLALKQEIFASLSKHSAPETILATNTSSLSVTSIAASSERPDRVVGMHFFNPAPAMPLVEVIAGARTSLRVVQAATDLARSMGKNPVRAADMPGFIVNRVARPFYLEAFKILGEGSATVPEIDAAICAAGYRMGPFELMDLIGIDINFAVTKSVYEAFFGEPRFRPHPIQQRMVEAGTLGRKSGGGFYDYRKGEKGEVAIPQFATFAHMRRHPLVPPQITREFIAKAGIELTADVA